MTIRQHSYSLIIPTRNRQRTALCAIESALNCDHPHLEIVVPDNSDSDVLYHELKARGWLEKLVYHKNDTVLSMRDNWERGLDLSRNEIVSVIGDDDAIMPDAHILADLIFSRMDIEVLSSSSAVYKWDCYPFPGRQNYLAFNLGDDVNLIPDPKKILRSALAYKTKLGTGPGLYYGFVKREFLEHLRQKRGRWLVDHVPDFDSGYATLMYAKAIAYSARPLFVQGHSGSSNSGSMRLAAKRLESYANYEKELNSEVGSLWDGGLDRVQNNNAAIVSCQLRLLPEIRAALQNPQADIDRKEAWLYIVEGAKPEYESIGFVNTWAALKDLARDWQITNPGQPVELNFPTERYLGIIHEQGFSPSPKAAAWAAKAAETVQLGKSGKGKKLAKSSQAAASAPPPLGYEQLVVNGQQAGFKTILDAVNFIRSIFPTLAKSPDAELKAYYLELRGQQHQQRLTQARALFASGDVTRAKQLLISVVAENADHVEAYRALAELYKLQQNWSQLAMVYSRLFTITSNLNDMEAYMSAMLNNGQTAFVLNLIQHMDAAMPGLANREGFVNLAEKATIALEGRSS